MSEKIFHEKPEEQRIDESYFAEQSGLEQLAKTINFPFEELQYLALFREVTEYKEGVEIVKKNIRKHLRKEESPYSLQDVLDTIRRIEEHAENYLL